MDKSLLYSCVLGRILFMKCQLEKQGLCCPWGVTLLQGPWSRLHICSWWFDSCRHCCKSRVVRSQAVTTKDHLSSSAVNSRGLAPGTGHTKLKRKGSQKSFLPLLRMKF